MAIVPLHRSITEEVLIEFGFSRRAQKIAADANAAVDEKQGSDYSEANLHSMRGYVFGRMQSLEESQNAVLTLLERARIDIRNAVRASDYQLALKRLGEGLHTVQDREFHHFEPWPFSGLLDAVLNSSLGSNYGLRPNYMFCHGLRDISYLSGFDFGIRYRSDQGWSQRYWVEFTSPSSDSRVPHLSVGGYGNTGTADGKAELAGYVMFTWGATPGSLQHPSTRPDGDRLPAIRENVLCPEVSQGGQSLLNAKRESRRFVEVVKSDAGTQWDDMLNPIN